MNAILERRSIRRYTSEPVSDTDIAELLEAAMCAPSAGNEQPWQFVVITERRLLDKIPGFHPYAQMLYEAHTAILVCGDMRKDLHKGYWVQDCAAAVENILIAVTAKGLGAVWVGIYPRDDRVRALRELLDIPEHVVPFALIPLGHPAEEKPPANRFDKGRIHYNGW
jgi:nitroreductase